MTAALAFALGASVATNVALLVNRWRVRVRIDPRLVAAYTETIKRTTT